MTKNAITVSEDKVYILGRATFRISMAYLKDFLQIHNGLSDT